MGVRRVRVVMKGRGMVMMEEEVMMMKMKVRMRGVMMRRMLVMVVPMKYRLDGLIVQSKCGSSGKTLLTVPVLQQAPGSVVSGVVSVH